MKYWLISFLIILSLFGCSDLPEMSCDVVQTKSFGTTFDDTFYVTPDDALKIIDWKNSTLDKIQTEKAKDLLRTLYTTFPEFKMLMRDLLYDGSKVSLHFEPPLIPDNEADYIALGQSSRIHFVAPDYMTMKNFLHELFHHYMYVIDGIEGECSGVEEYDIRVLVDIIVCKRCGGNLDDLQGIHYSDPGKSGYESFIRAAAGLNVEGEVLDSEYQYVCSQYWIWGSYFIHAYESTLDWSPQPNLFSMPILLKKFWYEFDQFQFMGI